MHQTSPRLRGLNLGPQIDRGVEVIVGVNRYQLAEEPPVDILNIDNTAVRESQIARLESVRQNRNEEACRTAHREQAEEKRRAELQKYIAEMEQAIKYAGEVFKTWKEVPVSTWSSFLRNIGERPI